MNVLKPHLRITVQTLLRNGASQREIERMIGVDRKTIPRIGRAIIGTEANSPGECFQRWPAISQDQGL